MALPLTATMYPNSPFSIRSTALVPSLVANAYAGTPVTALDFESDPAVPGATDDGADAHP